MSMAQPVAYGQCSMKDVDMDSAVPGKDVAPVDGVGGPHGPGHLVDGSAATARVKTVLVASASLALVTIFFIVSALYVPGWRSTQSKPDAGFVKETATPATLPFEIRMLGLRLFGSEGALESVLYRTKRTVVRLHGLQITLRVGDEDNAIPDALIPEQERDMWGLRRLPSAAAGTALDIGGWVGFSAIVLRKLCPKLRVLAFEPSPLSYFYGRWNLLENGVRATDCAGDSRHFKYASVEVCFENAAVTRDGRDISLRYTPYNTHLADRSGLRQEEYLQSEDVYITVGSVVLLQQLRALEIALHDIVFLLMDCEGCEYENVPSWGKLLNVISYAAVETHCWAEADEKLRTVVHRMLFNATEMGKYLFGQEDDCFNV